MVLINLAIITGICLLALARAASPLKILAYVHDWYVAPLVFFTFKELYFMIKPIHRGNDYDDWLIAADRWIFGVNPTEWLAQFSHPALTELLQIAYTLFYVFFLIVVTSSIKGIPTAYSISSCSHASTDSTFRMWAISPCRQSVRASRCTISAPWTWNSPASG